MTIKTDGKPYVIVWVPGTWGTAVHVGFEEAVRERLGDDAFLMHVAYPASTEFDASVRDGVEALFDTLSELEVTDEQRVLVAGSSQGAWVIREAMADGRWSRDDVYRVATFGLPGMSEFEPRRDDYVWDMASPFDAVTWDWNGPEARIVRYVTQVVRGRWWYLIPLLPWFVLNPRPTIGMTGLLMTHFRAPRLSPHDYTPQMPLTLAWLTN